MKSLFATLVFAFWLVAGVACGSTNSSQGLPPELKNFAFQTGDVIAFSELPYDPSTAYFEAATGSRYGHVAFVSVEPDQVYVYEEAPPAAQKTPLVDIVAHAGHSPKTNQVLVSILRPKITPDSASLNKMIRFAQATVAKHLPYNYSQSMKTDSMNCSEFVRAVFQSASVDVGSIEKVSDQNIHAFNGLLLKMWEQNEGPIDLNALVVSPMSVVLSSNLNPVFTNVPTDSYLSDHEIYQEWKSEGFTKVLASEFQISETVLDGIGEVASKTPWKTAKPRIQGN